MTLTNEEINFICLAPHDRDLEILRKLNKILDRMEKQS